MSCCLFLGSQAVAAQEVGRADAVDAFEDAGELEGIEAKAIGHFANEEDA